MKSQPFSLSKRLHSLKFAWNGFRAFLKTEHNARIHLLGSFCVFVAMVCIPVSRYEIIILVIVTGMVWAAELFNSAIEKMMDVISVEKSEQIKYIKDVAAGAVLVLSVLALACAAMIFIPKLL
jgi:diacylglycerol kinase